MKKRSFLKIYKIYLSVFALSFLTFICLMIQGLNRGIITIPLKTLDGQVVPDNINYLFSKKASWTQNFSKIKGNSLSSKFWTYDIGNGGSSNPGWGNNEAEYYTSSPTNISISKGLLNIIARKKSKGAQLYTSAKIKTEDKVDFEYGRIDIIAKLPKGIGTWPAIWLLPQKNIYYYRSSSGDPLRYLNDGEIDIMESIGAQPDIVTSSAQSRSYNQILNNERISFYNVKNASSTFNDYELEWTPNELVFSVNHKAYHTVIRPSKASYLVWPYNQPYYLIINDALGGNYGGMDSAKYPPYGINNNSLPATMSIKSIKLYSYIGPRNN